MLYTAGVAMTVAERMQKGCRKDAYLLPPSAIIPHAFPTHFSRFVIPPLIWKSDLFSDKKGFQIIDSVWMRVLLCNA